MYNELTATFHMYHPKPWMKVWGFILLEAPQNYI